MLDAIAWALGWDRYRPSNPTRDGSSIPPHIHIELSNGLIVERTGKNSSLKVVDPTGARGGQQILNEFVEQFALDLPKFMSSSAADKARTLLQIIGIGDQVYEYDRQEKELYNERLAIGRITEQKAAAAKELPQYDGLPQEPVSAAKLISRHQAILARNGENARKRTCRDEIARDLAAVSEKLEDLKKRYEKLSQDYAEATRDALDLYDESTEELEISASTRPVVNKVDK